MLAKIDNYRINLALVEDVRYSENVVVVTFANGRELYFRESQADEARAMFDEIERDQITLKNQIAAVNEQGQQLAQWQAQLAQKEQELANVAAHLHAQSQNKIVQPGMLLKKRPQ